MKQWTSDTIRFVASRSITMVWVALGHFYMFGILSPITGDAVPLRNRGDAGEVFKQLRIYIKRFFMY